MRFDDGAVKIFTRIAHAFQRTFGPSAFFLVGACSQVDLFTWIVRAVNYWWPIPPLAITSAWTDVACAGVMLVMLGPIIVAYRIAERKYQTGSGTIPTEAYLLYPSVTVVTCWSRSACLAITLTEPVLWYLAPITTADWLFRTSLWFTALMYFGAVVPLPPGPSRASELKRAWGAFFATPARHSA